MLIKACDTSNEVRPKEVAEPWVDCLLEEYFMQSDREKREGLPVAPFMDRDKVTKPTAQIGFIQFVLIPMFEALNTVSCVHAHTHTHTRTNTHCLSVCSYSRSWRDQSCSHCDDHSTITNDSRCWKM